MIVGVQFLLGKPKEIVVSGKLENENTKALLRVIRGQFLPNSVLLFASEETAKVTPLVQDRLSSRDSPARVFVCANFSCKLPSNSEIELKQALSDTLA